MTFLTICCLLLTVTLAAEDASPGKEPSTRERRVPPPGVPGVPGMPGRPGKFPDLKKFRPRYDGLGTNAPPAVEARPAAPRPAPTRPLKVPYTALQFYAGYWKGYSIGETEPDAVRPSYGALLGAAALHGVVRPEKKDFAAYRLGATAGLGWGDGFSRTMLSLTLGIAVGNPDLMGFWFGAGPCYYSPRRSGSEKWHLDTVFDFGWQFQPFRRLGIYAQMLLGFEIQQLSIGIFYGKL